MTLLAINTFNIMTVVAASVSLLAGFGYVLVTAGKTGGSRVRFIHEALDTIILHRPHPTPVLKRYQFKQLEEI
ncbi:MAG: type II toxin-antitoxin system HicA family toxin, partial [Bacteroidales bacterium]|nr:type II toxin-antitoxin system HicA family toxin [Bacteroidales bacterium]